jgi:UDP-N-acetylmuramoyl-tripeptide--D-alanyl-D-alanine ligase
MLELGDSAAADHASVGAHAAALGVDVLLTVGDAARAIADSALRTPGWSGEAVSTAGRAQAGDWLRHNVVARDVVLVKASRGAALEHLADELADELADDPAGEPADDGSDLEGGNGSG